MLSQRIQTAVILLCVVALLLFFGGMRAMMGLVWFITAMCLYEWYRHLTQARAGMMVIGLAFFLLMGGALVVFPVLAYLLAFVWCYLIWAMFQPPIPMTNHQRYIDAIQGAWVLAAWLVSALILCQKQPILLGLVMGVPIIVDSTAYFAGKAWGKRCIVPRISPNKTEYGFLTGYVCGAMLTAAFAVALAWPWKMSLWLIFILPALALCGDLWMSAMKRRYQCKDSGQCLPGHGGILDRLDSWLIVTPCVAYSVLGVGI